MPTVDANISMWERNWNWENRGEDWSARWGDASTQWFGSILPRLHAFLPAQTVLEIAPGFGRWTQFLLGLSDKMILVDIAEKCIEGCKKRFGNVPTISYFVNDGKSLEMVDDGSVDLIFSFDSLVHAEEDVISAYVAQFRKKLKKDGVAFIHHSNLGAYSTYSSIYSRIYKIPKLPTLLSKLGVDNVAIQWRAASMTAEKMASLCEKNGLQCVSQELLTWETNYVLIDCISVITTKESIWARKNMLVKNRSFMKEAHSLSRISRVYGEWPKKGG